MKKTIDQDAPKYVIERTHKETGKVEYLSPGKVNWIPRQITKSIIPDMANGFGEMPKQCLPDLTAKEMIRIIVMWPYLHLSIYNHFY